MNLEYIRSFIETIRHKSILKASEHLNISHTALSKQIRRMEDYFGVQLFKRSASGVELTEEGTVLYTRILPIAQEFESLKTDLLNMQQLKQSYVIATLPTIAAYYLPPIMLEMEKQFVKVDLSISNNSIELMDLLESGKADCIIVDTVASSRFSWTKELYKERLFIVVPTDHSLANHTSIRIDEIVGESFVLYPEQCSIRNKLSHLFRTIGERIIISSEVSYGELIMGYVAAGAGITVAPESQTKHLGYLNLKAIPFDHPKAYRSISMVAATEPKGRLFYRFLKL